jgi:hypothetical protein
MTTTPDNDYELWERYVKWSEGHAISPYTATSSSWGEWGDFLLPSGNSGTEKPAPPKCECGVTKTMGPQYDKTSDYHSDWCPCSSLPKINLEEKDK